jgi:hypothetical protein
MDHGASAEGAGERVRRGGRWMNGWMDFWMNGLVDCWINDEWD